jgi:hypothetical protein
VTGADVERLLGDDGPAARPGRGARAAGRRAGPGRERRTRRIFLIVNAPESETFERHRGNSGMGAADYARICCLHGPPSCVPPGNIDVYVRLSRLTSNLTQLSFHVEGGALDLVRSARRRVASFRLALLGAGCAG